MPTSPEEIAVGLEHDTRLPVLSLEHWGYWGAVFHPDYAEACMEEFEVVGILDRPTQDASLGEDYTEDRTEYPVFRHYWNPERRTL